MTEVREMVILPNDMADAQTQTSEINQTTHSNKKPNPIQSESFLSKLFRILKITIQLAKHDGFDDELHIKKSDGSYNLNSNLAQLLNLTQTKERLNPGLEDLIYQLKKYNVSPDLISNEIIRNKLSSNYSKSKPVTSNTGTNTDDIATREISTNTDSVDFPIHADQTTQTLSNQLRNTSTETLQKDTRDVAIGEDEYMEDPLLSRQSVTTRDVGTEPELDWFPSNQNKKRTRDIAAGPDIGSRLTRYKNNKKSEPIWDPPPRKLRRKYSPLPWLVPSD